MQLMGLRSIAPQKRTSIAGEGHPVYPYLLGGLAIDHANHVWCSDITYIPVRRGFVYLTVVMDWHSRYVLSWAVAVCHEMMAEEGGQTYYPRPALCTDNGAMIGAATVWLAFLPLWSVT